MNVSLIYAQDVNGAIGLAGSYPLPWHHPEDLARFKHLTSGKPIIMGFNTFDSLPRLLPGRFHYVLTHKRGLHRLGQLDSVKFVPDLGTVGLECMNDEYDEIIIIGLASVLREGLEVASSIYLTIVLDVVVKGDTVRVPLPEEDPVWEQYTKISTSHVGDKLTFETWVRK